MYAAVAKTHRIISADMTEHMISQVGVVPRSAEAAIDQCKIANPKAGPIEMAYLELDIT